MGFKFTGNGKSYAIFFEEAAQYAPAEFVNSQGQESFGTEANNIAMHLDGNGAAVMGEYLGNDNEEILERYESSMGLGANGETWVALDPFIMAKNVQDEEAAWETMKFLTGYEYQKWAHENFSNIPTLADADFVSEDNKFTHRAMEIAEISQSILIDEANPFVSSELMPLVNGFISHAANNNAPDIQEFLDEVQERAERWSANQ